MRHHVDHAAGCLISRQSERQLRVDYGEARTEHRVCTQAYFLQRVTLGDYRVARPLAARPRNGQHDADRQCILDYLFPGIKIPEITVIAYACGDSLGCVYNRPAPDGEQTVDVLVTAERYALIDAVVSRILLYAAEFHILYAYG